MRTKTYYISLIFFFEILFSIQLRVKTNIIKNRFRKFGIVNHYLCFFLKRVIFNYRNARKIFSSKISTPILVILFLSIFEISRERKSCVEIVIVNTHFEESGIFDYYSHKTTFPTFTKHFKQKSKQIGANNG